MGWKIILATALILAAVIIIAVLYGAAGWESGTRDLRARLEASREPVVPKTYDPRELEGLPEPVKRYFRSVLQAGQPMVTAVSVEHEGTFNMSESGEKWLRFTSMQRVIVRRPGFDWDGRISMAPGLTVRVHDSYVAGQGILHAALFGLVPVADVRGTPEVARGELMRFLAEAAWYPTALLPSQGVRWEAVDHASARATLRDGPTSVTLLFRFDGDGPIASIRAEARGRTVGGRVIPTPWEGCWRHSELRQGMRIPLEGEVAWILPQGPKPYWRGRITKVDYEFAQ